MPTAACLIIGNEILSGKVKDENTYVLAQLLYKKGISLEHVRVISDSVKLIAKELKELSESHDMVFTSGGIGPTHDDVTYEGVAKGLGLTLHYHEGTIGKMERHYATKTDATPLTLEHKKMANFPMPCEIIEVPGLMMPVVLAKNTYVLPGVPELFEHMIRSLEPRLKGERNHLVMVYTKKNEGEIAKALGDIQEDFSDLMIGSYPQFKNPNYSVMITVEGKNKAKVLEAKEKVLSSIAGFLSLA